MDYFRNCPTLCYFLISILFFNCTARFPASSIYARDEANDSFVQWPEVTDDSANALVRVRPLENIDEMLLFEMEVTNKSQEPMPINPESWQLNYFNDFDYQNLQDADTTSRLLTGAEVNRGYQKVADDIKAAKDGTTALIILGIVVIIVAIIAISESSKGSGGDNYTTYDTYTNVGLNISFGFHNRSFEQPPTDGWSEKQKIAYFRQRGQELAKVDNGPHTIPPGETYLYGLFFPRVAEARNLVLNGTIDNESYQWTFQHDGLNMPKVEM